MRIETKVLDTDTSDYYEVHGYVREEVYGQKFSPVVVAKFKCDGTPEIAEIMALNYAKEVMCNMGHIYNGCKIVKVTEVKSTIVTSIEDEDNYTMIS